MWPSTLRGMSTAPVSAGDIPHETAPVRHALEERLVELRVSVDRRQLLLVATVVAQAAWLGLIMLRGWYSGPDLGNLASASGRPLDWSYLSSSLGGHLGIPANFFFWLLNRAAPLNWPLTVLLRLVLQGASTVLLGYMPALDNTCTCQCMWGGTISIAFPGQVQTSVA